MRGLHHLACSCKVQKHPYKSCSATLSHTSFLLLPLPHIGAFSTRLCIPNNLLISTPIYAVLHTACMFIRTSLGTCALQMLLPAVQGNITTPKGQLNAFVQYLEMRQVLQLSIYSCSPRECHLSLTACSFESCLLLLHAYTGGTCRTTCPFHLHISHA